MPIIIGKVALKKLANSPQSSKSSSPSKKDRANSVDYS
jgi:hypothetical protein